MKSSKRSGFSLLEIIAAVIILAVVATATVATVAPMRSKSDAKMDEATLADLNGMAQSYYLEYGRWPVRNGGVWDLGVTGYIDTTNNRTLFNKLRAEFVWDTTTNSFVAK